MYLVLNPNGVRPFLLAGQHIPEDFEGGGVGGQAGGGVKFSGEVAVGVVGEEDGTLGGGGGEEAADASGALVAAAQIQAP